MELFGEWCHLQGNGVQKKRKEKSVVSAFKV